MTSLQTLVRGEKCEDNLLLEGNYSKPDLNGQIEQDVKLERGAWFVERTSVTLGSRLLAWRKKRES